jgi:hypothetical protein
MDILFHNETATIGYQPHFQYVWVEWAYFVQGDSYRGIMDEVLAFMSLKNTQKLLINQSQKDFSPSEDVNWGIKEWLPRFVQITGWYGKLAVVFSEKNVPLALERKYNPIVFHSKVFSSFQEAEMWLAEEVFL